MTERHTGYSEDGSCTSGDEAMGVEWWRRGGGLNEDMRWMVVGVLADEEEVVVEEEEGGGGAGAGGAGAGAGGGGGRTRQGGDSKMFDDDFVQWNTGTTHDMIAPLSVTTTADNRSYKPHPSFAPKSHTLSHVLASSGAEPR